MRTGPDPQAKPILGWLMVIALLGLVTFLGAELSGDKRSLFL